MKDLRLSGNPLRLSRHMLRLALPAPQGPFSMIRINIGIAQRGILALV